jgi:hypothetical protein
VHASIAERFTIGVFVAGVTSACSDSSAFSKPRFVAFGAARAA